MLTKQVAIPRTSTDDALRMIVEGTSSATGREFFRSLVRSLAGALGFRYAVVGELMNPADRVRTLAVWAGEGFAEDFEYALAGSPCEGVVGKEPCQYPEGAWRLFPDDPLLAQMGVESYLGVPLSDSGGGPLGLLAVMHHAATEESSQSRMVLQIFAARAASELERMRRDDALRASERRYQSLAEMSPVGIFHNDTHDNCTYANGRACQLIGLPAEQVTGLGWMRNLHPDDRERVVARRALKTACPFRLEYRFLHADGRVVWVLGQVALDRDASGQVAGYVGTLTDLTESKRADERRRQSEERYRALAENSAVGIWQVTLYGSTLYINPAMREMLQLGPDEDLAGRTFHSFFTAESLQVMRREHEKRPAGQPSSYEAEVVGRGGRRRGVLISGAPVLGADGRVVSLIGTFTDITDRKRTELALRDSERSLRESETRLRLVIGQVPAVLWTTDRGLHFTSGTGAGLAAMGLGTNEIADVSLHDFFQSDDEWFAPIAAHRRALQGHSSSYEQAWAGRTFQAHVEPLRQPDGAITGAIGVALDITERKKAEQVLRESHDALEARVRQRTAELSEANRALRREVNERRATEEALRESEQRYAGILNSQQTLVSRSDVSGRITYVNAAHVRTFGSKVGDNLFVKVHPGDADSTARAMEGLAGPPYACTLEQRCEVKGEWRTFLWQVGVIWDRDEKIVEYQGVGFDITDRRRAEEALRETFASLRQSERRAREAAGRASEAAEQARDAAQRASRAAAFNARLVLEVDHRVRNNLAGLLSLVAATRETAGDVGEFASAIQGRLMAMVHVHQLLADTEWTAVDLRRLVTTLLTAVERLGCQPIPVTADGPPVPVSPRQALPLSMILLEWFTNSCKYGAHSAPTGRVRVAWELTQAAATDFSGADGGDFDAGRSAPLPRVRLRWQESGGPPVPGRVLPSLGTAIVKGFAANELRGRYEPRYLPGGADYSLEFPAE